MLQGRDKWSYKLKKLSMGWRLEKSDMCHKNTSISLIFKTILPPKFKAYLSDFSTKNPHLHPAYPAPK